jgi:hypothetical protein
MGDYFDAFEVSPISERGAQAVAPEVFRGIYAMPAFVSIPTSDLTVSADFWVRGLGFVELFSVPGQVVHLRRWAFQDVLLVRASADTGEAVVPAMSVNFSCVLSEIDPVAEACAGLASGSVTGPYDTPWRTRDIEVITPERTRVVYTAAQAFDPESQEARDLAAVGIYAPDSTNGGQNSVHG